MAQVIDPERLITMRKRRGLSQAQLADEARHPDNPKIALTKNTVYRLEKGKCPPRRGTVERLAKALKVDFEVLTGAKPLPEEAASAVPRQEDAAYRIPGRISPAIRNAYELAARQYRVPVQKIAQLAPLLFTILAEASLTHQRETAERYWAKREEFDVVDQQIPSLDEIVVFDYRDQNIEEIEKAVEKKDVFGRSLWRALPADWDRDNPFAEYLSAAAAKYGENTVNAAGPTATDYRVCRDAAAALAQGDKELANSLLDGLIPLHQMPRGLTREQRIEWLRDHRNPTSELDQETEEEVPEEASIVPPELLNIKI